MEGGTVALWDGVSGEFVNFISAGGNSFSACTVNPVSHLQFVHRDGMGQAYRVQEMRGNTSTPSGPDDANDGLVGSVRVAGANAVQGFAMNPDGASFWTLEQPTRTDATIRRIRSAGEEVGCWKFAWLGSGADMAELKGGSLAAGSDPDEVVAALPVPGGFVSCSDDGFRIQAHRDAVTAVAVTDDGHWIASGSRNWHLKFWQKQANGFGLFMDLHVTDRAWQQLDFNSSGDTLVTLREDERGVRLFNFKQLQTIDNH